MRYGWLIIIFALLGGIYPHKGSSDAVAVCPANDGSGGAPGGTPQLPALLTAYMTTLHALGCKIAGVDYYVGIPSGTTLMDWQSISQTGVSVDSSNSVVTIMADNVTLSGIDFSLHGGAQLVFAGNNDTVQNSKFVIGTNNLTPIRSNNPGNLNSTVQFSTINGNQLDGNQKTLFLNTNNFYYNDICCAGYDVWDYGLPLNIKYNLVRNTGTTFGAHSDWVQLGSGPWTTHIDFNTFYQDGTTFANMGTQGVIIAGFNCPCSFTGEVNYNTIISKPNGHVNVLVYVDNSQISGSFSVLGNYMVQQSGRFFGKAGSPVVVTGNRDMTTGCAINYNNTKRC